MANCMFNTRATFTNIYCGKAKPESVEQFLRPFVDELKFVIENGIVISNHKLNIRINCFIADSPARALLTGNLNMLKRREMSKTIVIILKFYLTAIVYFNHRHGCIKCTVVGEWCEKTHCIRIIIRIHMWSVLKEQILPFDKEYTKNIMHVYVLKENLLLLKKIYLRKRNLIYAVLLSKNYQSIWLRI